jgi:RimJ/RimL family protein N-acetyltransferase
MQQQVERGRAPELRTRRLLLRRWQAQDLEPFSAISADPEVMEHFPAPLSREQSAALIERTEASFDTHGYGLWAVELCDENPLVGIVGALAVEDDLPFYPAVELGWRLGHELWGRGIATEGARAVSEYAFQTLGLRELVAYTAASNQRSQRVMERLGMQRDAAEDFMHPKLSVNHPLAPHVLYRLSPSDLQRLPASHSAEAR